MNPQAHRPRQATRKAVAEAGCLLNFGMQAHPGVSQAGEMSFIAVTLTHPGVLRSEPPANREATGWLPPNAGN